MSSFFKVKQAIGIFPRLDSRGVSCFIGALLDLVFTSEDVLSYDHAFLGVSFRIISYYESLPTDHWGNVLQRDCRAWRQVGNLLSNIV